MCVCVSVWVRERRAGVAHNLSCPVGERRQRARGAGDGTASLSWGPPASTGLGKEGLEIHNHHTTAKCKSVCVREIQALANKW